MSAVRWRGLAALAPLLCAAAVGDARGEGAPAALPDAGVEAAADAGIDPCGELEARLARRKAWLAARRQEQFERGGPPNPALGIPNVIGLWCEQHPEDEQCRMSQATAEVDPSELAWSPEKSPEDYAPEVVLMRRELERCRTRPSR